jgi:hypothetical protein
MCAGLTEREFAATGAAAGMQIRKVVVIRDAATLDADTVLWSDFLHHHE